ncbi:hypothetical protein EMPS_04655 [Entomortierella parvispora]|uniref:F-box domain-containing protein n=1 Tax=Entomortierella parvispora TaxID=205924 RepID=A0A9P3H9F9_9FUNG|nr:hypothetical protein EMPS_04655 [Entomortierella parvispora]
MEDLALPSGEASGLAASSTGSQGQETSPSSALPTGTALGTLVLPTGPQGYKNPSPLQTPELLARIGNFVDRSTLLACQVVCKEWHRTLEHLLWKDLKLVQLNNHFQEPMTDDCIRRHAPLVQRLSIRVDPLNYELFFGNLDDNLCLRTIDFPQLTSLDIGIQKGKSYLSSETIEMEYLTAELFRLMLESSSALNNGGQGLSKLQVLKITGFQFRFVPRDWATLWGTLWSRLQVLSLIGTWWAPYQVFSEEDGLDYHGRERLSRQRDWVRELWTCDETVTAMKRLGPSLTMRDLTMINKGSKNEELYGIQKWIITQCPKLVRLEWCMSWDPEKERPMQLMLHLIERGRRMNPPQFQDLQTLALPGAFDEIDYYCLLKAMPRLTELRGWWDFDDGLWELLKVGTPRHLETIRLVDIYACNLSSRTLIDLLCSLPNLEVLRGDCITDRDLREDPRPWACRGTLRRLELDFKITTQRRVLSQSLIASRLAEFEQLEDLIVAHSPLRLDLSKSKGVLERLKPLKNLKTLSLHSRNASFNCDWGQAELAWVRENWPNLKYVSWIEYKDEVREEDQFPPIPFD